MMLSKLNHALSDFDNFKKGIYTHNFFSKLRHAQHYSLSYGVDNDVTFLATICSDTCADNIIEKRVLWVRQSLEYDDEFRNVFELFKYEIQNLENFIQSVRKSKARCLMCEMDTPSVLWVPCGHIVLCWKCHWKNLRNDKCLQCNGIRKDFY